jgi:hypothetical protein
MEQKTIVSFSDLEPYISLVKQFDRALAVRREK